MQCLSREAETAPAKVGSIQSRVVRGNEVLYEVQWKGRVPSAGGGTRSGRGGLGK